MISHSEFSKLSPDQVLAVARDDWHLKHPVIEALTEQALSGAMLLDDCVDLDELFDAELATKCKVHCEYFKKKLCLCAISSSRRRNQFLNLFNMKDAKWTTLGNLLRP